MPYIKQERREVLNTNPFKANDAGELNYIITREMLDTASSLEDKTANIKDYIGSYLDRFGRRYGIYNEVIGVLVCARYEYFRRTTESGTEWIAREYDFPAIYFMLEKLADDLYDTEIAPYEDTKIKENGDVY